MVIPESKYIENGGFLCVTIDMVREHHTEAEVERFCSWFSGQTGIIMSNGAHGIYSYDYERWCKEGNLDHQLPGTWD